MGTKLELILFFHRTSFYCGTLVSRLLRLHFEFIAANYVASVVKSLGQVIVFS